MSALDLFASALGAFILISLVLMPYFLRVSHEEVNELRQDLEQAQSSEARTQARLEQAQSAEAAALERLERAQGALEQCHEQDASCRRELETTRQELETTRQELETTRQELEAARQDATALQGCQIELNACEGDLSGARSAEAEARERLDQAQGALEQCRERNTSCRQDLESARQDTEGLQSCQTELNACEERLSWTFLAVVIHWDTKDHDVDLHIVDAAEREFSWEARAISGRPGELSVDMRDGPGVEIWELVTQAPAGEYRVYYNLYSRHNNPEAAVVNGGVYYRNGALRFRERRLTEERHKVLIAVVTVGSDGSVDVAER